MLPKSFLAFPLRWGSPGNHEDGILWEGGCLSLGRDLRVNRESWMGGWMGGVSVGSLNPVLTTGEGWGLLVCGDHRDCEATHAFWGHMF